MRFLVLGATGGIGLEIVRQSVARGHNVTALVRSPERLDNFAAHISVVQADVLASSSIERALQGCDAVLSAFGPRLPLRKSDSDLLRRFSSALTAAMSSAGVSRLVIVSSAFLFKDAVLPPAYLFGRLFFPTVVEDAAAMEAIVMKSGLDWTIVRPPKLTDKPHTGKYRVKDGHLPFLGLNIPRADVADFMISVAETNGFSRKIVGVCR